MYSLLFYHIFKLYGIDLNITDTNGGNYFMNTLKEYTKFIFLSIIIGFILTCLIGVLLAYTNINDNMLGTLVFVATAISIFIGSTLLNRKFKKRGYLYGLIFGLIFFILIYTFSSILASSLIFNTTVLIYILMAIISGAVGGIIGVNI